MVSEWQEVSLGNNVDHQKGFIFKSKDYQDDGELIVRVSDFTDRSIDINSCNRIDESRVDEFESVKLQAFDVVIATVGSWPKNPASIVGKTISVPIQAAGGLLNQNAVRLRAINGMNQRYLFFLLKTREFQNYIVSTAQGSANQASITLKDIFRFTFYLPKPKEQKAIAHILGTLDDKIELNRQMNETLESMAQTLFKSWFVDFDPVIDNALAAGNPIPDVFAERVEQRKVQISARKAAKKPENKHQTLFPSEFEFTEEVGWVPKGWQVAKLKELLDVKYGKDHKKLEEGTIPVYGSGGLMRFVDKSLYVGESILIPRKGTLSNLMFVDEEFWTVDTMFFSIPKGHDSAKYLFYSLKMLDFSSMNVGSAVPSMTTKVLNDLNILMPYSHVLIKFHEIASDFFLKQVALNEESGTLSKLRDTLLPKLLSGELRIPNAEKLIEEACA